MLNILLALFSDSWIRQYLILQVAKIAEEVYKKEDV